jgi:hypothetical protein
MTVPHAQGKKVSRRHTTLIDAAHDVVKAARRVASVTNMTFGVIEQVKGSAVNKRLKIEDIPAGLRVVVRGSKTIQELFIYTTNRQETAKAITKAFRE